MFDVGSLGEPESRVRTILQTDDPVFQDEGLAFGGLERDLDAERLIPDAGAAGYLGQAGSPFGLVRDLAVVLKNSSFPI